MRRQDRKDGNGGLTEVHGRLLGLYKYDDIYSAQIFDFQSLINTANRSPYDQHPELSGKLEDAFSEFQDIREKHLIGVAKQLTGTIKRANLYVVCEDRSAGVSEGTETFYTARLSDITHERRRSAMTFNVVVEDFDGNEGLLPPNLYVFAGACAIAS